MEPPPHIADPVAAQTQWTPLEGGGANFCTHALVQVSAHRIEFRALTGAKVVCLIPVFLGLAFTCLISFFYQDIITSAGTGAAIFFLTFGMAFVVGGLYLLYVSTAPIAFDRQLGLFWKGRKKPEEVANIQSLKGFVELAHIHALQLIAEYIKSSRGDTSSRPYHSYELNLVLHDGQRVNIIDHGHLEKIRAQGRALSEFLEKPLWDAITHQGSSRL
jgi:hypothetical protein